MIKNLIKERYVSFIQFQINIQYGTMVDEGDRYLIIMTNISFVYVQTSKGFYFRLSWLIMSRIEEFIDLFL